MTDAAPPTIHASACLVDGTGVLVRGGSGSGKSSLVLALIVADRAANRLVADDRVVLSRDAGRLMASPPAATAGLIELRGHGILRLPFVAPQEIGLVVDLEPPDGLARMPAADRRSVRLEGLELPRLTLPIGLSEGWIRVRALLMAGADQVNDP